MNHDDCMFDVVETLPHLLASRLFFIYFLFSYEKFANADKLNREKRDRIETVANFSSN